MIYSHVTHLDTFQYEITNNNNWLYVKSNNWGSHVPDMLLNDVHVHMYQNHKTSQKTHMNCPKKKVKWITSDWWMVRLQTPCQGYWKVMVLVKLWSTGAHAGTQVCLTMTKTWPVAKLFWETILAWYHMLAVKLDACLYIIFNFLGFLIFSGYQIRNSVLLKIV